MQYYPNSALSIFPPKHQGPTNARPENSPPVVRTESDETNRGGCEKNNTY